jgi:hypothetical protein
VLGAGVSLCCCCPNVKLPVVSAGAAFGFPNNDPLAGSEAFVSTGFPNMNPEGLPPAASVGNPDPNPADVVVAGGAPKEEELKENMDAGLGASAAEVAVDCPNVKLFVAELGSSLDVAAVCPDMGPPVASLGSSLAAPNANDVDVLALLPNNPPVAGAGDVGVVL